MAMGAKLKSEGVHAYDKCTNTNGFSRSISHE